MSDEGVKVWELVPIVEPAASGEKLDATQRLALGLMGIATTYQYDSDGEKPPTCSREMLLYDRMRAIADGQIKVRDVRKFAEKAIASWESDAPNDEGSR